MQSSKPLEGVLLAYAAGLVDSDGAIGIRRRASARDTTVDAYWPRLRLKQVDRAGIDVLVELFGGKVATVAAVVPARRPSYLWELTHQRAADACAALLPYLQIKPAQAALAVACMTAVDAGRWQKLIARPVEDGVALLPLTEAARLAGRRPAAGYAGVRAGTIPAIRRNGRLFVPESFVAEWASRPRRISRDPAASERLESLYQAAAALNRGDPVVAALSELRLAPWSNAFNREGVPIDERRAYIAGVVDADGYIGIARNTYRQRKVRDATQPIYQPRLEVKQVTTQAVDFAAQTLEGSRFTSAGQHAGSAPLAVWAVHSAAAVRVCDALLPYLRIKEAQARAVLEVGAIHAEPNRRRFPIPKVRQDEPLVPLSEAAARAGRRYDTAHQSVRLGNIPFVRKGRSIYVPESYIETWAMRGRSAVRRQDLSERLEALYLQCRDLNAVGVEAHD